MILRTQRLILRPWRAHDAAALYEYASDPRVGPMAGWPVHTSVQNSLEIINGPLGSEETYAVTLAENDKPVGSIGIMLGKASNLDIPGDEGEIGYWIAVPYWGQGLIPEAAEEIIRHGFGDLKLKRIWCGYFDGNDKSRRVGEKCKFKYCRTETKEYPLINAVKTQHITCLTREDWEASAGKLPLRVE